MKKYIIIVLIALSFCDSDEKENDFLNPEYWDVSCSYGFLSEKFPMSFIEFSGIFNIDDNNEFYGTFSYMVFGGGLGVGHKYYLEDKFNSSLFFSTCIHGSVMGSEADSGKGISISLGYSKIKDNDFNLKLPFFPFNVPLYNEGEFKKTSINFGITYTYMDGQAFGDQNGGLTPFINIEKRF